VSGPDVATVEERGWLARHAIDVRPLRHAAYRRMFIGSAVSFLGFQFTAVAVPVQMFDLTHSSAWVGFLGIAGLVPLLIFAFGAARSPTRSTGVASCCPVRC